MKYTKTTHETVDKNEIRLKDIKINATNNVVKMEVLFKFIYTFNTVLLRFKQALKLMPVIAAA